MRHDDALPVLKMRDMRTNTNDHAGQFMAQRHRRLRALLHLERVAAAETATRHPQEQFVGADLRHRNVLQADVIVAMIDDRAHRRWNRHTPLAFVVGRMWGANGGGSASGGMMAYLMPWLLPISSSAAMVSASGMLPLM